MTDIKDFTGIEEVHSLVKKAKNAQEKLALFSQKQIDAIVHAMEKAGLEAAEHLARLACGETGMGRVESKIAKNKFAVKNVCDSLRNLKTCGVLRYDEKQNCYEIAEPVGVIAAVVPTTNPTSTALFKALISLKSRNSIVFAPHPKAIRCTSEAAKIMKDAAIKAGAPDGCIECIQNVSLTVTQELMKHPDVDLILATGGPGLVEAAYKSGKPALGVGQGNSPAYIDRSANVAHAVRCLVESQTFDFGTICSSEQSVIVDLPAKDKVLQEFQRLKAYLLSPQEVEKVSHVVIQNNRMNADIVGQPAYQIARKAGLEIPIDTSVLLAPLKGVGEDYPLSKEKLCPVLAFYEAKGWEEACKICMELLSFEGMGHTLVVHATNPEVIMEFGLQKNVSRIIVNAPSAQGGVGLATGLVPSMTLGCGTFGKNITTDNISAHHLFNVKRVAAISKDFPLWGKDRTMNPAMSKLEISEENLPSVKQNKEEAKIHPFQQTENPQVKKAQEETKGSNVWAVNSYHVPSFKEKIRQIRWP
ncbi:MAG: aldehyde dehydrogenase family protein [Candidatus Brocadiae bacterium]|nr:aldehyde dehydrogenase family protein [Candidatus Brocadiia bacterium]